MSKRERLWRLFHRHHHDEKEPTIPDVKDFERNIPPSAPVIVESQNKKVLSQEASSCGGSSSGSALATLSDLAPKDRWRDAFRKLSPESQTTLRDMGFETVATVSMEDSIAGLVDVVNKKQKECEDKFWSVSINGKDVVLRNYTASLIGWLEKAGDIAIQFAPPQASLPWSLVKNVMQIPVNESEQMGTLLAITETVVRVTSRGQVYEQVYLPKTSEVELDKAQMRLESSLMKIYTSSLELLVDAKNLLSAGTAKRTLEVVVNPGKITESLSGLADEEAELLKEVNICETTRKVAKDDQMVKMLETLNAPMARIDEGIRHLLEKINREERMKILEWISPIPHGEHHDQIRERRVPKTGHWLLKHYAFQKWDRDDSSGVFWLYGSAGTGKTYVSSRVIDHLQENASNPLKHEGFAFFYCQHDDDMRSERLTVLQSIVRQLAASTSAPDYIQSKLSTLYKQGKERGSKLRLDQCEEQIIASINLYQHTTILIDALDECKFEDRGDLINSLLSFLHKTERPVRIFISSRPEPDIQRQLNWTCSSGSRVAISASDNEEDIRCFLEIQLDKPSVNDALRPLKKEIIEKLMERCQGMFQWAFLQVRQIARCNTRASVWHRLNNLPTDLEKAYDEVWNAIDEFEKPQVIRAIFWVMCSAWPIGYWEILPAIRISPDGEMSSSNETPDPEGLLNMCSNLLDIGSDSKWRFTHLSVKEYMEKNQGFSLAKAHEHAAAVCLSYMVKKYVKPEPFLGEPSHRSLSLLGAGGDNDFEEDHYFQLYIRHYWYQHVRRAQQADNSNLKSLLKSFLGAPQKASLQYGTWHRKVLADNYWRDDRREDLGLQDEKTVMQQLAPESNPVFAICRLSLGSILADWWNDNTIDISAKNSEGQNLLLLSILAGDLPLSKSLMKKGLDASSRPDDQAMHSALNLAASQGNLEIVKYLVGAGADVNIQLRDGSCTHRVLESAIESENADLVRYLIEDAGADIDIPTGDGSHLIAIAASRPGLDIIKLLLKAGADVNTKLLGEKGDSVLAMKVINEELDSVRYLVERAGADVNMKFHSRYGSALEAAHNFDILKYLVQEGKADVNSLSTGGDYGNALTAACCRDLHNRLEAVEFLVKAGANINIPTLTGSYGSALVAAVSHDKDIARYLLKEGADPNLTLQCGKTGSVLAAACTTTALDLLESLLQGGADINQQLEVGSYGSALACFTGAHSVHIKDNSPDSEILVKTSLSKVLTDYPSLRVFKHLLAAGADVNMTLKGRDFGCALSIGAAKDSLVLDLIEAGADVNIQHQAAKFPTPLIAAAFFGQKDVVECLIEAGADFNLKLEHARFPTVLKAAQAPFTEEDVMWFSNFFDWRASGFQKEAEKQKPEIVEFLREKGAIA